MLHTTARLKVSQAGQAFSINRGLIYGFVFSERARCDLRVPARAVIAATKQRVKKGLASCLAAVNDVVTAM